MKTSYQHPSRTILSKFVARIFALTLFIPGLWGQLDIDLPQVDTLEFRITDTVYMSVHGDDSHQGTLQNPVRSFQRALELLPFGGPGGEEHGFGLVRLLPGVYETTTGFGQTLAQWKQNDRYKNVSIEGIGEVSIQGTRERPASGHLLHLIGNHIYVKNIRLKYGSIHGILLARQTLQDEFIHDVIIENVRVDSVTGFSMLFSGTERVLLERCTSAHAARLGEENLTAPCQWPSGIKFIYSRHATIRHSEVFGTRGEGLNFQNTEYGLAEYNDLHDNPTNLYMDNSARIVVRNNRIYGTPGQERNWKTCPPDPTDSIPPIGILIANEGACPDNLTPVKDRCGTNCIIPFGPVIYRYSDADSIFIYQNIMHQLVTAVAFWEGVTQIVGVNCLDHIYVFHNSIIGSEAPRNINKRGMFDFFFPAIHNLITNSNFSLARNIRIEANIISYPGAGDGRHPPVRIVRHNLFPVPLDVRFSNNLWPAPHAWTGIGDEVRLDMPQSISLDSLDSWVPCPERAFWEKQIVNEKSLDLDFKAKPRGALTNVGAFEFDPQCTMITGSGREKPKASLWVVYPNPASEEIRIQGDISGTAETITINIMNSMGQIVRNYEQYSPGDAILVGDLSAGIYFIQIQGSSRYMQVIPWIKN